MTCIVLVGGFFGDEGKGKVASYLAIKNNVDANVRTGSVNAGHTVVWGGVTYRLRMVPSGFVNPRTKLYLAAGCNINPSIFLEEVKLVGVEGRIWIDRQASVIESVHIERDRSEGGRIGTTGQGVGPAQEDRVKRIAKLTSEVDELKPYLDDVALRVNEILDRGCVVLLEGTQGTYLSLIHGTYPYVTSRDTTASAICSEVGIGPKKVDEVIVVFKSYVTRVGKGPLEGELSEEEARRRGWLEVATVTGRVRRSAPFNFELARRAVMLNSATQIAITKLDSLYPEAAYVKSFEDLPREARMFIERIEDEVKVPVTLIGTGPRVEDVVDRRYEIL
ncbi:MAG: adenylosuccinate synthetase [Candidatus Bathyarchaeia archaeon]